MDTVPNKVEHLFMAQLFHDRKQNEDRLSKSVELRATLTKTDFLRPIIGKTNRLIILLFKADADTGHGGITANMKLAKMFVERGAAGVHLEGLSNKSINVNTRSSGWYQKVRAQ